VRETLAAPGGSRAVLGVIVVAVVTVLPLLLPRVNEARRSSSATEGEDVLEGLSSVGARRRRETDAALIGLAVVLGVVAVLLRVIELRSSSSASLRISSLVAFMLSDDMTALVFLSDDMMMLVEAHY
jgi:hypothetical protein